MSPEPRYEIFQKFPDRKVVWVESATGLDDAKLRINELEQMFPGSYLIFDSENLSFIAQFRLAEERATRPIAP